MFSSERGELVDIVRVDWNARGDFGNAWVARGRVDFVDLLLSG